MYFPILGRCWAIFGGPKIEKISKKFFFLESIQNSLKRILNTKSRKKIFILLQKFWDGHLEIFGHVPSILFAGAHQDPPGGARAKPEYCICRGFDDGSKMIVFDGCDEWFQANCLDILEDYIATLESESLKWYCPGCSLNANSNYVA